MSKFSAIRSRSYKNTPLAFGSETRVTPSAQNEIATTHDFPPACWQRSVAIELAKVMMPDSPIDAALSGTLNASAAHRLLANAWKSEQSFAPFLAQSFTAKSFAACWVENFSAVPYAMVLREIAIAPYTEGVLGAGLF
jgi:hypothetical protein